LKTLLIDLEARGKVDELPIQNLELGLVTDIAEWNYDEPEYRENQQGVAEGLTNVEGRIPLRSNRGMTCPIVPHRNAVESQAGKRASFRRKRRKGGIAIEYAGKIVRSKANHAAL
jgi:hypothetical protein